MITFFLTPLLLLLVVIVQVTMLNPLSWGWITLEFSLIIVIYCGFHLDALRGGLIALILGFFLDCLMSTLFGLYLFVYQAVFALSLFSSGRVYREKPSLIALFTAFCVLLEGMLILLSYRLFLDTDLFWTIIKTVIPQAIVLGLLSPLCFRLLHLLGILAHAEDTRPLERL